MALVVCTRRLAISIAEMLPGHEVVVAADNWRTRLPEADALVTTLRERIDDSVLAAAPRVRVVANCAVGVDNIDVAAATARGIAVANTPDVLTEATADFTWALILAAARRLGEGEHLVRSGRWTGWEPDQLLGVDLTGATLGIVGLGRIGSAVARRASAFAMNVVAAGMPASGGEVPRMPLRELLATADVISLHCPLTPATRHLIDAAALALVKPTAILINTARGPIVDEDAVTVALETGRLFGAGFDVYEDEPRVRTRLLACPRAVLAPHLGSATTAVRRRMAELCAQAVGEVLAGRRPPNLVGERA